ncbi:small, acid-soluble spore protein, alpha/beta type [Shimazuella sp. KC615]|uniref:Small, acid-soluble spore protein, alpha/beta type n=1 Tax=Shimazuella alba TaxID=2690964 RepID=A0A6I4VQ85_9BACL|nr:alpha/beta-type small acid-soluble spore protein [Shimazuella alba]MXQ53807.1 small, acid-soluble spore protein, alpha/beta type [Shimazuella alba]
MRVSRRRKRNPLVPGARNQLDQLQTKLISEDLGRSFDNKEEAKLELAKELGVPLQKGSNRDLRSEDAGKVGGAMGGRLVKELIQMSLQSLEKNNR